MTRSGFTFATLAALTLTCSLRAAEPTPVYSSPMPGTRVFVPVNADTNPMPKSGTAPAPVMPADCCGANCDNEGGGGITFAFGAYFLRPVWERNPSHSWGVTTPNNGVTNFVARTDDFDFDTLFSPRIQLGYVAGDGLGIRAGYQYYHQAAFSSNLNDTANTFLVAGGTGFGFGDGFFGFPVFVNRGETLLTEGRLRLDQFELEVTQEIDLNRWKATVAGGVRYTDLSQSFNAFAVNANGSLIGAAAVGHRIQGVGPTVAIDSNRPLGNGLSVFANARGSLIFGHADFNAYFSVESEGESLGDFATSRQDILPIGEIEIGAQYARETSMGNVFVRIGWYGAAYFGAGSSGSEDGNLGFHGFSASFGISR